MREIESMVREVSTKVTEQYNDHVVSALDPLFEFNVGCMDLDDNSLNIMTTPWAYFRSRVDEIGISLKYDVRKGKEIPMEGIDQKMKLVIGPIESLCSFYRAFQFLGSAITNTDLRIISLLKSLGNDIVYICYRIKISFLHPTWFGGQLHGHGKRNW